jgi:hypothetical protein
MIVADWRWLVVPDDSNGNGADQQSHGGADGSDCQDSPMNGGFAHERAENRYCQGKTRAGPIGVRPPCRVQ